MLISNRQQRHLHPLNFLLIPLTETRDMNNTIQSGTTPLLSLNQVADHLQVSIKTIRRWIEGDDLIAHRFGRQLRISELDLQTFIKSRREP